MEVIVFVAALCALAVLAVRFGHDSRESAYSKEQDLARFGLSREEASTTAPDPARETARDSVDAARLIPSPD